jgi:alkylation response protein AidB-like acyl-CoA dehydrogenase
MEMAVEHARDRKQFGRPIGVFQAVSHPCAQMLLEVEGARSAVMYAAWALDDSPRTRRPWRPRWRRPTPRTRAARVPAARCRSSAASGFTWEHDLHFWLKARAARTRR